jgi:sodium-independent sulfate anion transporter 11
MAATKVGHILAKGLGIKLNYRDELNHEIRRGESVFSTSTADTYVEEEPTSVEWIRDTLPSGHDLVQYTRSLFPFTAWIGSYNVQWLIGDLVAGKHIHLNIVLKKVLKSLGITVGAVVVPQSMAYAALADLAPQFGLYSSFMGVLIYWFFATSKDITIGVSNKIELSRSKSNFFFESLSL